MKGDFTRSTFRRERHFSSVRMQQGRVQVDADWNEQVDIQAHGATTTRRDVLGPCGGPLDSAAFQVRVQGDDLVLGAGRYYVDGILCENEQDIPITEQPDLPGFELPTDPGIYLAYLDVWERHLTYLQEPSIREVALGGPDTATRTKTIWQAKLLRVGDVGADLNCLSELAAWNALTDPSSGRLLARGEPATDEEGPCIVPPGAGFRGLENQLYRAEIHDAGPVGSATFKWSRDNGSVAAKVESIIGDEITVSTPGRDLVLGFAPGQWIELADERSELLGLPGTLVRINKVDGRVLTVDTATATGPLTEADFPLNPIVRRWDSAGRLTVEIPSENDGFIQLENGVEVKFEAGSYKTGDYWLIPARTLIGDVEWSTDSAGQPIAQAPEGIHHHYCRLALIEVASAGDGLTFTVLSDCRSLFPPITQLTNLFYVSGDGQEALHDPTQAVSFLPLAQPLQVGVSMGEHPVEGATIRFTITEGSGRLQGSGSTVEIVTDSAGLASCTWELDPNTAVQEVEASLLNANGDPVHLPVRFSATLLELTSLFYVSGDGQEAMPDPAQPAKLLPLPHPLQVGVTNGLQPVQGATVRFEVTQGNGRLAGSGPSIDVATGTDGIASCAWELDSTTLNQQVQATLLGSGGSVLHLPVRFSANLSVAGQVAYNPSACARLEGATTVQEAIDRLCQMDGEREPGVVIREVRGGIEPFDNDVLVPVAALRKGITLVCDRPVEPASLGHPTCFVTIELPFPFTDADRRFWAPNDNIPPVLGFQPLVLAGQVKVSENVITWVPSEPTAVWLEGRVFPLMQEFQRGDRLLTRLTVKGNFVWAADNPDLYLDGEAFGEMKKEPSGASRTGLRLPSGDGRRGGDFEMWFWLVQG